MNNQLEDGEVLGSLRAVLKVKGIVSLVTTEKNTWLPATGSCIETERHLISYQDEIAIVVVKHAIVKVFAKDETGALRSQSISVPTVRTWKTKLSEAEALLRSTFNISEIELLRLAEIPKPTELPKNIVVPVLDHHDKEQIVRM